MKRDFSAYAPVVLRWSMAIVYAWFGTSQLTNPAQWILLVPTWATQPFGIDPHTVILLNGVFEVVCALLLVIGTVLRPVTLVLFAHLLVIAFDAFQMGSMQVAVRDFGLSFATFAIALFGEDIYCYDPFRRSSATSPD